MIPSSDRQRTDELAELLYAELRRMARHRLGRRRAGETLRTTALVHEAYLRLAGNQGRPWESRAHFLGAAARAMRHVLVDAARARGRLKRHRRGRIPISQVLLACEGRALDVVLLDEALGRLAAHDRRACDVVTLRVFGGLTIEEVAEVQGVSSATVERDWGYGRAWLFRAMRAGA